jgi:hypothetical protein
VIHKPIPRASDGKPDLTWTWQGGGVSITGKTGSSSESATAHRPPSVRQRSGDVQTEFDAMREAEELHHGGRSDPVYCLLPGVPRIRDHADAAAIVQTPKEVVILYEAFRAWRRIRSTTSSSTPTISRLPGWRLGRPVGRRYLCRRRDWFNDKTWIGGTGTIHTEQMHVQERYTLNDDGSLL